MPEAAFHLAVKKRCDIRTMYSCFDINGIAYEELNIDIIYRDTSVRAYETLCKVFVVRLSLVSYGK